MSKNPTLMQHFDYINTLGAHKRLDVYSLKDGKHPVILWNMDNGELCASDDLTPEEVQKFLANYGIDFRV